VGGDTNLSHQGQKYARRLGQFMKSQSELEENSQALLLTSTMKRTCQTVDLMELHLKAKRLKKLDEIDVGICDGKTVDELEEMKAVDHEYRNMDKVGYRYP
jgi:broad specificity phosphatase PhoE